MNKLVHIGKDKFSLTCVKCNSDKVEITIDSFHDKALRMAIQCTDCDTTMYVILPYYEEKY